MNITIPVKRKTDGNLNGINPNVTGTTAAATGIGNGKRRKNGMPFGKNLALVMRERGLSHRNIATLAGVSVSTVSDWLANAGPTDYMKVASLAHSLKIDFEWFLTGTHSKRSTAQPTLEEFFEEDGETFEGIWKVRAVKLKIKTTKK